MIKSTLLSALVISAALPSIALSAETVLHKENFQNVTVRVGPTGSEWKPGETIPGYYAVIGALELDGTPKYIVQNLNGERGNSTHLYLFEKEEHKSLGFSVGVSTGAAILALRLENHSGQTIKEIDISFIIHQWTAASTKPKVVKMFFTEDDPASLKDGDVFEFLAAKEEALKWTEIPDGNIIAPLHNMDANEPVNPLAEGAVKRAIKQSFLDWKPKTALWIKWDFSGNPWDKMSLTDIRITTPAAK